MDLEYNKNEIYIGSGGNACCYLMPNGKVKKIFKRPMSLDMLDKFKYFLKYQNDSIVFPVEFLVDKTGFYGYITKYIPGKEFSDVFSSCDLLKLSSDLKPLEQDIDFVSTGKIVMNDVSSRNILYDGSKVTVIDPDCYKIYDIYEADVVKKDNMYLIRDTITNLVISPLLYTNHEQGYIIDRINKYKRTDISISDLVLELKKELEDYYRETITCVDDIKKL